MHYLGLCGSLRAHSYNHGILKALQGLLPANSHLEIANFADIPLYNQDVQDQGFPTSVLRLATQIQQADRLIFACPEYNYSVSGVLKNAIDWISRHPKAPFTGKSAAIVGASPGKVGTARAQYHLRQIGVFLDLRFLNRPEIMIGEVASKCDETGRLTDPDTLARLQSMLVALAAMGS